MAWVAATAALMITFITVTGYARLRPAPLGRQWHGAAPRIAFYAAMALAMLSLSSGGGRYAPLVLSMGGVGTLVVLILSSRGAPRGTKASPLTEGGPSARARVRYRGRR